MCFFLNSLDFICYDYIKLYKKKPGGFIELKKSCREDFTIVHDLRVEAIYLQIFSDSLFDGYVTITCSAEDAAVNPNIRKEIRQNRGILLSRSYPSKHLFSFYFFRFIFFLENLI